MRDSGPAARDATELIEVNYEELPAVIGVERALAPGAPLVHDTIPGNITFDFDYGDEQKTKDAIARADHVVRLTMESPRVASAPRFPRPRWRSPARPAEKD